MKSLFSKNRDFFGDIFRNIISQRKSEDVFDDINDSDEEMSEIASIVEEIAKKELPLGLSREFHYNTSITYPFETEPYMASRYSNGTFPVWYGSLDVNTTLYETAYHMMIRESQIEGVHEKIIQERALYQISCKAILIDISEGHKQYPKLISNDYSFTQEIGSRVYNEGHPGLLAPSARCQGIKAVIFSPKVLNSPRHHCYFTYSYDPLSGNISIQRTPGKLLLNITKKDFYRRKQPQYETLE